jgi:hypothetical protein
MPFLARGRGGVWTTSCLNYFSILYVRSPAAFLDESILSPPLLPRMLTKPRTVCACHLVAAMISANVAPLARFIRAMTSAFLLARSAFGLPAAFLTRAAFFAVLAFLRGVRFVFGCGGPASGVAVFSVSIIFVLVCFSLRPPQGGHLLNA